MTAYEESVVSEHRKRLFPCYYRGVMMLQTSSSFNGLSTHWPSAPQSRRYMGRNVYQGLMMVNQRCQMSYSMAY